MSDNYDDKEIRPIDTTKPLDSMDALNDLPPPPPLYVAEENLVNKGDYFDIRRKIPELKEIVIGAGWDHKMFEENPVDVDLSCFLINRDEQTREDEDFVFYNNDKACSGAVRYMGDSRNGAGDGDDESIIVDLNALPFDIMKITVTLTIYEAAERNHHFGLIRNFYMRIVNAYDDNEIFRYKLSEDEFSGATGIKLGELIREGPKWYFSVTGEPIPGGLASIATKYGLIIQM